MDMRKIISKINEQQENKPVADKQKLDDNAPSLKKIFEAISTTGMKPVAVLDPKTNKPTGAAVITSTDPELQNIVKNLDPKKIQVVQTTTGSEPIKTGATQTSQTSQTGLSTGGGATSTPTAVKETKKEAGKSTIKTLRKMYRDNEADNNHTENALLLALHFGTADDVKDIQHALRYRDRHGGYQVGDKTSDRLYKKVQNIHTLYYPVLMTTKKIDEEVQRNPRKWKEVEKNAKTKIEDLNRSIEQAKKLDDKESLEMYEQSKKYYEEMLEKARERQKQGTKQEKLNITRERGLKSVPPKFRKPAIEALDLKTLRQKAKDAVPASQAVSPSTDLYVEPKPTTGSKKPMKNKKGSPSNIIGRIPGQEKMMSLKEKITKKTPAGEIISDFEKSKDPKFKDKSKAERKKMALGAYYGMHPEKSKKKSKKKTNEAERPSDQVDLGAGLGRGRNEKVLETTGKDMMKKKKTMALKKKKVSENVNSKLKAAYQEGYAHGLREQSCRVKHYEDMEEARQYYDGYKKGLDECYGMANELKPVQGMVDEVHTPSTVHGMADQSMHEVELDEMINDLEEMNRTQYMKHKAKTTPGNTFKAFGQKFNDSDVLEDSFDTLDETETVYEEDDLDEMFFFPDTRTRQDKNRDINKPTDVLGNRPPEGIAKYGDEYRDITRGHNKFGEPIPDYYRDRFKLGGPKSELPETEMFESLDKQLNALLNEGLSVNMQQDIAGMGDDSVSVTATGDDASKLLDFIKQVGLGGLGSSDKEVVDGDSAIVAVSDYGAPSFSGHDDMASLIGKVIGDEDHSDDSHNDEDYKDEQDHEHEHAKEGAMCNECGMNESGCGCDKEKIEEVESEEQMEYEVAEDSAGQDEVAMTTADENAEAKEDETKPAKGGAVNEGGDGGEASEEPQMTEEAEDNPVDEEDLTEWANDAGKKGTDAAFNRDIDFMTRVISGGLNKPKSTGQQTVPVLAGDKARTNNHDDLIAEWRKLSGL